jgi:hypothetical protein
MKHFICLALISFVESRSQRVQGEGEFKSVATVRSNATGKMMEFVSVSAGAASCSVQEGNAFAD